MHNKLEEIITEELYKYMAELSVSGVELDEKSVPEPYNRNSPPRRIMTKSQITKRDTIGKKMKEKPSAVNYFKKKFGGDWQYYLWATATNRAIKTGE